VPLELTGVWPYANQFIEALSGTWTLLSLWLCYVFAYYIFFESKDQDIDNPTFFAAIAILINGLGLTAYQAWFWLGRHAVNHGSTYSVWLAVTFWFLPIACFVGGIGTVMKVLAFSPARWSLWVKIGPCILAVLIAMGLAFWK
jgi:hypothetical protein